MKLTFEHVKAVNSMLERLGYLDRWTGLLNVHNIDEANKQALNCVTAYLLAKHVESKGKTIQWTRFPKIAIYRGFQKISMNFDIPEHTLQKICNLGNIDMDVFDQETKTMIAEKTDDAFATFICEGIGTYENRLYKAATKIVTYAELFENERKIEDEFMMKVQEITNSLNAYFDIPGVKEFSNPESKLFKLIRKFMKLRYQDRWQTRIRNQGCPVLRHLFDTAVCAYFMHLELHPDDELTATKMFFMGIFHDVAEAWTKDIPSPVKDRIKGFRKATEEYEQQEVEENFYNVLPNYLVRAVKEVMMEDEQNAHHKRFLKGADYISADMECWRLFRAGSKDEYYADVFQRRTEDLASGKSFITPLFKELFDEFVEEIKQEEFSKEFFAFFKECGNGDAMAGLKRFKEVFMK